MMIASKVSSEDDNWRYYCMLISITQYLFAPKFKKINDLAILQMLIQSHHDKFISIYPHNSVIPKLHYLLHMPRLIYE